MILIYSLYETAAAISSSEQATTILDLLMKGGIIMIPIFILSIIAVYIFFERYFAIKRSSKEDPMFMEKIKDYIHAGQLDYAITLCQHTDNTISRMIEKGIRKIPMQT